MSKHSKEGLKLIDLLNNEKGWYLSTIREGRSTCKGLALPDAQFRLVPWKGIFKSYVYVITGIIWDKEFFTSEDHKVLSDLIWKKIENSIQVSMLEVTR